MSGDHERDERSREEPAARAGAGESAISAAGSPRGEPAGQTKLDSGGIWIGIDVGTVRVGVARSDPAGVLASPLVTLTRDPARDTDIIELAAMVADLGVVGVVVGLPRTLRGHEGTSAEMARAYAERLAARISPVPVHHLDERLTTVSAQRKLHQNGVRGSRKVRAIIDQAAAVELLQHWLDVMGKR